MAVVTGLVALRCPGCQSIGWSRDGFTIADDRTGAIAKGRVAPATFGGDGWTCTQCRHEVEPTSDLAHELNAIRITHVE